MEQFVLGIFQEQLSKFIVGFRKEQVNANLLNGKGEIQNVDLNCAFLNETISKVSPFLELERVHVSKLSFHVSSWTNLRKAPIRIDIEHVHAVAIEPLHFVQKTQRKSVRQITKSELIQLIHAGLHSTRQSYNIFDRILDNLTIEIVSVTMDFQPMGKFKTRRKGPWTPPAIEIRLAAIRVFSVNEYGQEAPPEEVWRHNHHHHGTLTLYKKLEMEYQISIRPNGSPVSIPLVSGRDNKMEVHVAMQRRVRDGEWLAIQIDATVPKLHVDLPADVIPHLAHWTAGVAYTISKDRGFVDPLKPTDQDGNSEPELTMRSSHSGEREDVLEEQESGADMPVDVVDSSSSSESEGEESGDEDVPEKVDAAGAGSAKQGTSQPSVAHLLPPNQRDRPVIVLPNGLVIHEKLTFSLSVHDAVVRGMYAPKYDGHVQVVAKGCIIEAIWPKISQEKGGYAQASLSYLSVQERYGQRLRTVLVGGVQFDGTGPVEKPSKPLPEISRDESFPLFEDRSVRADPLGLRHSFPAQAFGLKTTVDFSKKLSSESDATEEEIHVHHEIGIERFDVVLDTHAWCRVIRFALNEDGDGFDPRWHTGDWTDSLKPEMLISPKAPLNLDECRQEKKQLFLDENEFISSDLFNMTTRITNVNVRIPAPIHEDARSCDILIRLEESMLVVSSALPRTFLSGKIGNSIYGDDVKSKGVIDFPNDPSDIAYVLENTEDPSSRQRGVMTSRAMSTFRLQLTLRDFSIRIVPVISLCTRKEPHQLLAPSEMTMIVCFEGEPPETPDSNLTKMALFVSFLAHRFEVNLDFDLAASAVSTLLHHAEVVEATLTDCLGLFESEKTADSQIDPSESSVDDLPVYSTESSIRKSLRGRKVLVRRQIHLSRETGGVSVAFCLQLAEFRLHLWRQNVPYTGPLRPSQENDVAEETFSEKYVPLVQLMDFEMKGLEIAVEGSVLRQTRRIILKGCMSEARLKGCDLAHVFQEADANVKATSDSLNAKEEERADASSLQETKMLELFALGSNAIILDDVGEESNQATAYGMAVRFEERLEEVRSFSFASDIASRGVMSCRVEDIETLAVLILEALLMPTWSKSRLLERDLDRAPVGLFPPRTVGSLFISLVPSEIRSIDGIAPFRADDESTLELVGRVPGKGVDRLLRDIISKVLPKDVELLLLRSHISNFLVNMPGPASDAFSGFGLLVHQLDFSAGYVGTPRAVDSAMLGMLARRGETWSKVMQTQEQGLQHRISSRQSLNAVIPRDDTYLIKDNLIPAFDLGYTYAGSKAFLSLANGLEIENLERIDDFIMELSTFLRRCKKTAINILGTLATLRAPSAGDLHLAGEWSSFNPVVAACSSSATTIRSVREVFGRFSEEIADHDQSLRRLLTKREREMDDLRYTVFAKERERIGALALVAAQVTGWLRVGGAQKTGQRGLITCMLWPHWSVVRRSLLIMYSGPGNHKPVDIVSLAGATLHQLGGGRRKRDLKRAFAIVETTGMTRLLVAGNDTEYFAWVQELQKAIDSHTTSEQAVPGKDEAGDIFDDKSLHDASDHSASDRSPMDQARIDYSSVHSVDDTAKSTTSVEPSVVEASAAEEAYTDESTPLTTETTTESTQGRAGSPFSTAASTTISAEEANDDADTQNRRGQLRSKFAGVSSVTKRGLGSAFQAAKQKSRQVAEKSREVAERRRQRTICEEEGSFGVSTLATSSPTPADETLDTSERQTDDIVADDATSVVATWECSVCTFLSLTEGAICQMCGTARDQESAAAAVTESKGGNSDYVAHDDIVHKVLASDTGGSVISDFAEDADIDSQSPRRGMRDRLGAAVNSVRRGKELQEGGAAKKGGRFSLRRRGPSGRQENGNVAQGAPEAIRLKNVMVTGPLASSSHPFGDIAGSGYDLPLKKLKGSWFVRVSVAEQKDSNTSEGIGVKKKPALSAPLDSAGSTHESEASSTPPQSEKRDGIHRAPETAEVQAVSLSDPPLVSNADSEADSVEPDYLEGQSREVFHIRVFKHDGETIHGLPVAESDKTLSAILALHIALSESVAQLPLSSSDTGSISGRYAGERMSESLAGILGLSTLDTVRITGRLLGGLLQNSAAPIVSKASMNYHAEVIAEFLNSILDCPLPIDGLATLTDFLLIVNVSTENAGGPKSSGSVLAAARASQELSISAPRQHLVNEVSATSVLCEAELLRAEKKSMVAERLANVAILSAPNAVTSSSTLYEYILPSSTTERFQEAMHSALMKVMEERDEAHANMVAANVLHVHAIEQQKKKFAHLSTQLELAEKQVASNYGNRLRMGATVDPKDAERLRHYERAMQQNSDEELVSLCQQLAGEISARTSASLEVIRLKESRTIERDNELSEKQALKDELLRMKQLLALERKRVEETRRQSETWKQTYEAMQQGRESPSNQL